MSLRAIFIFFFCFTGVVSASSPWSIDEEMKFNFTYFPDEKKLSQEGKKLEVKPLLSNVPSYLPDIENISYRTLLDLGFPLPAKSNAENLRFLLKLYEYPDFLKAHEAVLFVLDPFSLQSLSGFHKLKRYVENRKNLALKFAVVDKKSERYSNEKPFVPLTFSWTEKQQAQEKFQHAIPFTSIYLNPEGVNKDKIQSAKDSTQGVEAFHREILSAYRKNLKELSSDDKAFYFMKAKGCPSSEKDCVLTVIQVPRVPMIFENYLNLPMPHDPKRIFLTGLLLLKATDYQVSRELATNLHKADFKEIREKGKDTSSLIMEIGSVWRKGT